MFVARHVFQLAKCSKSDRASCWYAARPKEKKKVQKKMTGSRGSDVRSYSETNQLLRSFAELIDVYSGRTATSWKCNELVAY